MKNNITAIVFKKELTDIFRDRKTLILGILIPLILFPVLFGVMSKSVNSTEKSVQENLKIAVIDNSQSSLGKFLKAQKNVKITSTSNKDNDVKNGNILLAVEIPDNFDNNISSENQNKIVITYDNSSQKSMTAMDIINKYIDSYSKEVVKNRLSKRNISADILNPVSIETKTSVKEKDGTGKFMLSLMLPLLLVIYSVTGPMAPATDLGAGEKERGTLEPLLTTQAGRLSLLWGKFLAITVMGCLTTAASLGGLIIAMQQKGSILSGGGGAVNISPLTLLLVGVVSILVTMVFGALELSISIYARSFKEAQTYLSPLTIIAFVPVYSTYMLDAKNIENYYFHIPLANCVCLLKEFIMGIYNYTHIGITFAWIFVYIIAAILFARFMFSREDVIFRT